MYIVLTLCVLWFVLALYFWHRQNVCGHKLPPALPGALPIIGHNHILYRHRKDISAFSKYVTDFAVKSGGVICLYFGDQMYYVITDLADAAAAAKALSQKHYMYKFLEPFLGQGLVTASGSIFHHHRKLLNPMFSLSVVYRFLDVFNHQSRRLTDILDGFVGQGPVDTSNIFKDVILRTTCITVLGVHDEKDNDFINTYVATITSGMATITERLLDFRLHSDFLFRFSSVKKREEKLTKVLNSLIKQIKDQKLIEKKNETNIDSISESDVGFRSFLDKILDIAADGSLSDKEIEDELKTVAAASYETTSKQLVCIVALLGTYPVIQEKVFKEVMEVVGDTDITKENISQLIYTDAFIRECIRVATVTNVVIRHVDRDLKLKNYTLRTGTGVMLFNDVLHRQPAWGSDANEFRPERWLENEQLDNLHFGFGYGQRVCVGKKYAMVSMKVTLAHIVRKFRIKADFNKIKFRFEFVMEPETGHEITLEKRI